MISFYPGYFGWLGNQMFQYAATYATSMRANTNCAFPENDPNLFDLFNLTAQKVKNPQGSIYQEPAFHYSPIPKGDNVTLHGYFQSEKHFSDYEAGLREEFTLRNPKYPEELDDDYIGIHVRRGDYLNHPTIHPTCSMEYYEEALSMLPDRPVKVFSDDPKWCAKNFKGDRFEISQRDFMEDFELLSKCNYHIIANSSFSWWAAWLSNSKKVIAPDKWFGPRGPGNAKDIIPTSWIKI
tara:strand:+ start:2200 stop:2913 length:714 start_codon:yes stop_codon:yes gene_type:complete